jgi:hypothetical protein
VGFPVATAVAFDVSQAFHGCTLMRCTVNLHKLAAVERCMHAFPLEIGEFATMLQWGPVTCTRSIHSYAWDQSIEVNEVLQGSSELPCI